MPIRYQKTISSEVSLSGVGLHSGIKSTVLIKPAKENAGIVFIRTDLETKPLVPANVDNVVETNRGTILENNSVRVHTVEHILSALNGFGLNNAIIELSGPEPPIMDGSALPFIQKFEKVGSTTQKAVQNVFRIIEPIQFSDAERNIEINVLPAKQFKITFFMDYGLPNFGLQYTSIEDVKLEYRQEIAPARTFGLLSEVANLKQNGFINGGNLDNAVIYVDKKIGVEKEHRLRKLFTIKNGITFNDGAILNAGGLRFENEAVRHKVLDIIGDFALLGRPFEGHVVATRSGHSANIKIVKMIKQAMKNE